MCCGPHWDGTQGGEPVFLIRGVGRFLPAIALMRCSNLTKDFRNGQTAKTSG
jgi:hypothetical protein